MSRAVRCNICGYIADLANGRVQAICSFCRRDQDPLEPRAGGVVHGRRAHYRNVGPNEDDGQVGRTARLGRHRGAV